jgi:hypothetical protein
VDQDHLSEPPGLRHENGGGRGRDQPVEQEEPAVRHGSDRARQPGQGHRVGPGPRAGNGEFPHVPAERGELTQDAAVVPVATAGSQRVVDAVRNDGVDARHGTATEI